MTLRALAGPTTTFLPAPLLLVALVVGCTDTPAVRNNTATKASTVQPVSELTMALDSLRQLNTANSEAAGARTVYYLNQWLSQQDAAESWSPDPMLDTLASSLKPAVEMVELERLSFEPPDLGYLQQSQWLRDVAERTRRQPSPPHLQPWLKEIGKSDGPQAAEQLAAAERLFDWTIRNIQLDELPPPPKAPRAGAGGDAAANTPPLRGEVGPGYGHTPLQVLLYGHGDAWERSRMFLLLARQVGIDGGILAIADPQSAGNRVPWCCALMIGDDLYLFDAELGLPLPLAEGEGIATLQQVIDNPELLRRLDIEDGPAYRVDRDDLKRLVALIDADPLALAHRMQALEAGLPQSRYMALSVRPSELQKRFRQHKQIGQISLWRVPFQAQLYQIGLQRRLAQDPAAASQWSREHGMFGGQHPLLRARDLHLQGMYEDQDVKQGARTLYLSVRPSEKAIDRLGTSTRMREQIGLNAALPDDPAQRSEMLENLIGMARRSKQHATYWLGLSYYEDGNYEAAKEWLDERTLEAKPTSPWNAGARYNLARAHEQLGEVEQAIELYRADDSPQRHGNLLRARRLEERSAAKDEPAEAAEADSAPKAPSKSADEPPSASDNESS